jgi:hypothetical protein
MTVKMVAADPAKLAPHTIHTVSGGVYKPGPDGAFEVEATDVAEMMTHGLVAATVAESAGVAPRVAALESRIAALERAAKAK